MEMKNTIKSTIIIVIFRFKNWITRRKDGLIEAFSLNRASDDHWLFFRVDEKVEGFSHEGYTELVFQERPTIFRLMREFNSIYNNDDAQGLMLVKSIWHKLDNNRKENFFKNFSLKLDKEIQLCGTGKYSNLYMTKHDARKRAEIYLDKLDKLYNQFYFGTWTEQEVSPTHFSENPRTLHLPLKWKTIGEYKKGHIKDFLAWASIPFTTGAADIDNTEAVKIEYFKALGNLVGVEVPEQPLANISMAKKQQTFHDIASDFVSKITAKK